MTAKTASQSAKKSNKSWYQELFFNRRRPHLRALPKDWQMPDSDDAYQKQIHDDGFVSPKYWSDDDLSQYPVIVHDAYDLAEYLLPSYFEYSQKSKHYQDRFYFYQWVFVIGAFLTTVAGAIATLLYIPPNLSVAATAVAEQSQNLNVINWQQVFSIITAIIGTITTIYTALSNRHEPQKRWGKTRRLTEELRMHYFTYLSHMEPYNTADRLQRLRENVINIRVKEQENV
ncbi:MAG: DUF4231 domain-containing protein [Chloroflexi bacterium]|nr:DUF4231 domain-containing protein [Chloroflexota bacterium]MCC6895235.1 DUF4231 domain-containing protein [Anaerolineae bacterium]